MKEKNNKNNKGFTLIELITVITIIGILATILVPSIYNYVKKARITAAIGDTKVIKSAVETALIEHLMCTREDTTGAFNKVLYLDQNTRVRHQDRQYEIVGAFTNRSWYLYKSNANRNAQSASQKIDLVIAGALDDAFTENWQKGKDVNPMGYNTNTKNCAKYLKDNNTNFALIVVYNKTGNVRMIQIYRKDVLVTYINGEYIVNDKADAHFIGTGTWNTIYTDNGQSSPEEFCRINLSNKQIGANGNLGGWY